MQCLLHIGITFTRRDNAHFATGIGVDNAVEVIGANIGFDQRPFLFEQLPLHGQCAGRHDDAIKLLGIGTLWQNDIGSHIIQVYRARRIAYRRRQFQRGHHSRMARQRYRMQTQADNFLDIGRIEGRHHTAAQHPIASPR